MIINLKLTGNKHKGKKRVKGDGDYYEANDYDDVSWEGDRGRCGEKHGEGLEMGGGEREKGNSS